MLKIVTTNTATEHRWRLCGQLAGPWVAELQEDWERQRRELQDRRAVVDLSEVIFIDERGEKLLREMWNAGAEFVARGMDTRDLLDHLDAQGERPLRKFVAHMGGGCAESSHKP